MIDTNQFEETICESKEESIRKALLLMDETYAEPSPISRPNIKVWKMLSVFFLWVIVCCSVVTLLVVFDASPVLTWILSCLVVIAAICINLKKLLTGSVLLYQRFAPEKLRRSCLYTPSCSEYMLLSIEKYGSMKGFAKGCGRLCRCHKPNGGIDYP